MQAPYSVVALLMRDGYICAVTRRDILDDLGLPGGKIDPTDANPEEAVRRELREETGVIARGLEWVYERIDSADGKIAWCYRVHEWYPEPCKTEDGIYVAWVTPERLLDTRNTFRDYNRGLLEALKIISRR